MTDIAQIEKRNRGLRNFTLVAGGAATLFWIYTFYFIANKVPQGDGTGFQWLGEVPLTFIFVFLIFPAMSLAWSRKLLPLAAGLMIAGLIADTMIWTQLLEEFGRYKK